MKIIQNIDFKKGDGLVPVITQDSKTQEVLMLAYMNKQAFELTLHTKYAHYYSRSRQSLWKKGEQSGHTQEVVDILIDCDNDTILLKVIQKGVACHTGRKSCFFTSITKEKIIANIDIDTTKLYSIIDTLYHTIQERKTANPSESWTAKLLQGEQNSMLKKIVEEAGEFAFAVKDNNNEQIIYECADLVYHTIVALASCDISPHKIKQEIARRFGLSGIEEKNNRQNK